ncbi:MAG: ABC transporter substrate-binding protein, partial [Synergistaceae bacterium]|jgi:ABC-type transport system substrate-binding protein|nr:ABC transporter substrate-binding protein [Synergistaceae bacterium]
MFITFSMKDATLADKDLRYALSYALDKDAIVKACYGGTARTATGYYPSNVFAFKEIGVLPYDPEKAKDLMKKAGHESGLTLNFLVEPREMDVRLAEAIQNMWNRIGLKVNIFQMAFSNYTSQGNELQIGLRAGNANEPSNILIVYDPEFGERLQPNDEKLAAMLKDAITFYDNDKRAAAYGAIQDYLNDMRYSIPLAFTPVIYGISDKVEGFDCDPLQQVDLCKVTIYE